MTSSQPDITLVTGANGLIGSHIIRRYLDAGRPVAALRRAGSDLGLLNDIKDRVTWFEGDILDIPSLEDALQTVQTRGTVDVIHVAAMISYSPKDRDRMDKVNVEGTANVVNICLAKGVRKLGYVSSVAAIGRPTIKGENDNAPIVIDEDQRWEESPQNSFYGQTKYRAELEVWRGVAEGLNAVMVNPSLVLGEGDWTRSSTQLFKYAFDEKPFYPAGIVNLVDVRDVAEAVFQLMQSDITAERFILSAKSLSYKDFLDKMADAMGKKRPKYRVSPKLTQLLWPVEAVRAWITGKAPLITRETARSASGHYQYQGRKIEQTLPFHYRNMDETIQRISVFFKRTHDQTE
ncbi:NAD-dependent epimerase/dehydratase family protein [Larkinella knui]|uniref:SDR family NAD(P)-dependent oxidoreductase n=1 Tax=Larkinella knui TaxID=2025310 RepID=A0A3P1CEI3_9BACT|nr:SDR family NAD(P)-dependent oxidoreductase [Larkinella knui]RRB11506.1 SDR family NAD(P)-dependent oxidoreductase [Larkinella knui]